VVLHGASGAGRGRRRFGFFHALAVIHFGLTVHFAVHRAILHGAVLHSTILHGAILHTVSTGLAVHSATLHSTAGRGSGATLHSAGSGGSLGKSRGAQAKGTGGSGENLDGLHDK